MEPHPMKMERYLQQGPDFNNFKTGLELGRVTR